MAIALITPNRDTTTLEQTIQSLYPGLPVFHYPFEQPLPEVRLAVLWQHPPDALKGLANVSLIYSLGAGVDHLIFDPGIPESIPIARIVDPELAVEMSRYIQLAVLFFQKNLGHYLEHQTDEQWDTKTGTGIPLRIGIMGLGQIGWHVALQLQQQGFEVIGYSNRRKKSAQFPTYCAQDGQLLEFAAQVNMLVCLLPLTAETRHILNRTLFAAMPFGSFLINVGRGLHLQEADFLEAIESGRIKGAFLDVFQEEPLPREHPFRRRKEIISTPHIASLTNQEQAARQIVANYRRLEAGFSPIHTIDRQKGY